jgi:GNAT superfamily N-acetyltransferase
VAESEARRVVAFGILTAVAGRSSDLGLRIAVDPTQQHNGVGQALMETLKDVAVHRGANNLIVILSNEDLDVIRFLEAAKFKLRNYTWQLLLSKATLNSLGRSPFPAGLTLASLDEGQEQEFHEIIQAALRDRPRFERYHELALPALRERENYQPGDIQVLRSEGQAVGLAVLHLEGDSTNGFEAEVEPVGVIPAWRNQDVELALLKAALVRASERGATMSEIWVHSADSLTLDVYTKVGFERAGTRLTYICKLAVAQRE